MWKPNYSLCQRNGSLISLSGIILPIIILTTLPKRVVGVVKMAKIMIIYVPKSNKGHLSFAKTCLLALLSLSLTLTFNACKLTSKWYLFCNLPALWFKSLPFFTALNCCMTRLAIVFIIRMVTAVVLLTIKVTFQTWNLLWSIVPRLKKPKSIKWAWMMNGRSLIF